MTSSNPAAATLWPDTFSAALRDCVNACGGPKVVAGQLWPEKQPEAAHRLLLDCLNDDRPAHLTPDHLVLLLRLARIRGCHIGAAWLMRELGYCEPQPLVAQDEAAELQRAFAESVAQQRDILARFERLQALASPAGPLRAVG